MATLNIKVITTWNNYLYEAYAYRFKKTYNWPFEVIVYNEDESILPDLKEFVDRNKHRQPISDFKEKGLDFLTDGVRFSYKVYAYTNEIITNEDYTGLICIDADSVFYKMIDEDWIKKHIHNDKAMMTYLGRGNHYSECGFLYFNMKHPEVINYAIEMQKMYNEDLIYKEKEQHDSYIWDLVRKRFEKNGVVNKDIGDGFFQQHIPHFEIIELENNFTAQRKGKRKVTEVFIRNFFEKNALFT